jgi:hypothetical protein
MREIRTEEGGMLLRSPSSKLAVIEISYDWIAIVITSTRVLM